MPAHSEGFQSGDSPGAVVASRTTRKAALAALVIFLLSLPVFARLVFVGTGPNGETTDFRLHIGLALDMIRKQSIVPHPLFHGLLLALIGGDNEAAAPGMMAFLLAAALGVRAYLSAGLLATSRRLSTVTMIVLCLALALAMPLPNWWNWPNVCRGQAAPNAWYNPTGVFAMPFALALFLLGMRSLSGLEPKLLIATAVGMILCLLAKPNYVLAFAPCYGAMLATTLLTAVRSGQLSLADAVGKLALVFAPTCAVLALQYLILYGGDDATGGRLLYAPMEVWGRFSNGHIYSSILVSMAFPLGVTLLYPAQANNDRMLVLAWSVTIVGMIQFALIAESGSRIIHANLSWGMMLAAHVLFVVSCTFLLRQAAGFRQWLAFTLLGLHVASGVMCLVRSLDKPWLAITF